jgi:hypothetical protein
MIRAAFVDDDRFDNGLSACARSLPSRINGTYTSLHTNCRRLPPAVAEAHTTLTGLALFKPPVPA